MSEVLDLFVLGAGLDDSDYSLVDALGGFTMQDVGSGVLFFTEVTLVRRNFTDFVQEHIVD